MSALHRFLVEFDLDGPTTPRGAWPLLGRDPAPPAAANSEAGPLGGPTDVFGSATDDLAESLWADPVAEAVAAALAEAEVAHAAALAAADDRHAAQLAEARLCWAADEGRVLAEGLQAAVATLEQTLAEGVGAAIEPLIGETLRVAAVAELRRAVGDLVLCGSGSRIAVSGPADLLEALQAALAEAGTELRGLDFTAAHATEVTVTSDTSTIETRLGAWARTLQSRLGDDA
ncbi:MAG: hypothetical protein ACRYGP_23140 [Janthinobacterium lividum]